MREQLRKPMSRTVVGFVKLIDLPFVPLAPRPHKSPSLPRGRNWNSRISREHRNRPNI
ncbi:hypothetical protein C8Q75DRAFT_750182 [Abortiporus biennis]|nr:hypothetical protein C8Q75DRAFT_750182 [Abortiporus biennis]